MDAQTKYILNKINRRRFLQATGAATAGAAFLAACSGNITNGSSSTALQQWYHQYGEDGTQQAVLKYASDYGKTASTTIKITWVPGDYATKLSTALLSNNPPDVFEHYTF